jgi:hypothetical protein
MMSMSAEAMVEPRPTAVQPLGVRLVRVWVRVRWISGWVMLGVVARAKQRVDGWLLVVAGKRWQYWSGAAGTSGRNKRARRTVRKAGRAMARWASGGRCIEYLGFGWIYGGVCL